MSVGTPKRISGTWWGRVAAIFEDTETGMLSVKCFSEKLLTSTLHTDHWMENIASHSPASMPEQNATCPSSSLSKRTLRASQVNKPHRVGVWMTELFYYFSWWTYSYPSIYAYSTTWGTNITKEGLNWINSHWEDTTFFTTASFTHFSKAST